jgi:Tol biopolymer transport system component
MTTRRRLGLVAAAWFGVAITVTPVIAAVTNPGGHGLPAGGPAAPLAISLEPGDNNQVSSNTTRSASDEASVSPDGQWVTYRTTLVGASPGSQVDSVLLTDRIAGTTIQIFPDTSLSTIGTLDRAPSLFQTSVRPAAVQEPSVSGDGSLVAFGLTYSDATPTIMLWRRGTGLTFPLSGTLNGNVPGLSNLRYSALHHPRLSADGSVLAFESDGYAGNPSAELSSSPLAPGFYVMVLATGRVEAVSAPTGSAVPGPYGREYGSLAVSDDGSVVAFASSQNLLAAGAAFGTFARGFLPAMQIWRRDRSTLTTTLVSAAGGLPTSGGSDHPALSSDGSVVAFESAAANLVPNDGNGITDIFSWTAASGIRRISVAPSGTEANGPSAWPAVSADGRSIAFASVASNLVPGDTNGVQDLFVAGPETDRLARVSVGIGLTETDDASLRPSFALNARLIYFESSATNLVRSDRNGNSDIFVRDRRPPQAQPSPSPSPSPTPTPTPTPVVKPAIIVSPDPVDFGSVPIGTLGVTRSATILSVGTGPVQIGAIAVSGQDAGDFLLSANPCSGTSLAPGASCGLGLLFIGTATGTRTALLSVASNAGPPEVVRLIAAVGVGILRLDPPLGPTGTVTIATGKGFPANAPVDLRWSVGITPTPLVPVFTDASGAFTAQVLVLPRDREGPRTLRALATLSGVPATPATAPFLVIPWTAAPPVSGLIQVFSDSLGQPIILRR